MPVSWSTLDHLACLMKKLLLLGKTFQQTRTIDIPGAIGTIRYYAGWADKVHGQSIEV
jgi:acyl-CoA reductase-like NAD-dependent aldehyde dehydrogenase